MADIVSSKKRSEMMSGIKGANTRPEMVVRSALHRRGLRFRLHDKTLPGKPDLVFSRYKAVIMVHGCFWHGHDCHLFKMPSSNTPFWESKISGNMIRDIGDIASLDALGWRVLVIWECAVKGKQKIPVNELAEACYQWITTNKDNLEIKCL